MRRYSSRGGSIDIPVAPAARAATLAVSKIRLTALFELRQRETLVSFRRQCQMSLHNCDPRAARCLLVLIEQVPRGRREDNKRAVPPAMLKVILLSSSFGDGGLRYGCSSDVNRFRLLFGIKGIESECVCYSAAKTLWQIDVGDVS